MTGRLAPGAKVVAAMPGLVASASPSVAAGWLNNSAGVSTVTDTKVSSGEMFKDVPAIGSGAGDDSCDVDAGEGTGAGGAFFVTGLGVTTMLGSCVCAWTGAVVATLMAAATAVRHANDVRAERH
jgi:hypothetical protein